MTEKEKETMTFYVEKLRVPPDVFVTCPKCKDRFVVEEPPDEADGLSAIHLGQSFPGASEDDLQAESK